MNEYDHVTLHEGKLCEQVARKLGWRRKKIPPSVHEEIWTDWENKRLGVREALYIPNYTNRIEEAWELTAYVPLSAFRSWPTPKEICMEFLKAKYKVGALK